MAASASSQPVSRPSLLLVIISTKEETGEGVGEGEVMQRHLTRLQSLKRRTLWRSWTAKNWTREERRKTNWSHLGLHSFALFDSSRHTSECWRRLQTLASSSLNNLTEVQFTAKTRWLLSYAHSFFYSLSITQFYKTVASHIQHFNILHRPSQPQWLMKPGGSELHAPRPKNSKPFHITRLEPRLFKVHCRTMLLSV